MRLVSLASGNECVQQPALTHARTVRVLVVRVEVCEGGRGPTKQTGEELEEQAKNERRTSCGRQPEWRVFVIERGASEQTGEERSMASSRGEGSHARGRGTGEIVRCELGERRTKTAGAWGRLQLVERIHTRWRKLRPRRHARLCEM